MLPGFKLVLTGLDLMLIVLGIINLILIAMGMVRFALFNAIDSVLYFLFPKLSLKIDYRKYYPGIAKDKDGNVLSQFRTAKDTYYPDQAPFLERISDFILRFPFIMVVIYFIILPLFMQYFAMGISILKAYYPNIFSANWSQSTQMILQVMIIVLFLPFSSVSTVQIAAYIIIVYPFMFFVKATVLLAKFLVRKLIPAIFFSSGFLLLFFLEVCLIYVGFLPLFHKGILPFIAADEGLKQMIFWFPVKLKVFLDPILVPIVVFVPFVTTIGSYILATNDMKKTETVNFPVLLYRSAIAYIYGPVLGILFSRLRNECRTIRNERKINEILVFSMFLESFITVVGAGYAYYTTAAASKLPMGGIYAGLFVLFVFVPLIVFSTNGFQSQFLHKATIYWAKILTMRSMDAAKNGDVPPEIKPGAQRPEQHTGAVQ